MNISIVDIPLVYLSQRTIGYSKFSSPNLHSFFIGGRVGWLIILISKYVTKSHVRNTSAIYLSQNSICTDFFLEDKLL